ncbi:tetratricopeptide repeat protein [Streptomyces sp. H39-S7]|uniref:tetratricopeptide repeat protein n=1 Tax=Streptomyces sp. H39-S7 TaxID=3004357 RepID=UPI0022AEDA65|nr:tetratricopeptide repeat protein [Streptomyces sp. H39-S7]MCZ4125385.1 tetratricopeptide repeat protein [Streptomyces sp. H39-S7]
MTKVTRTRRIERAGVNSLRALLEEHDQIVQEIDGGNDYGEDLFVMLTKNGHRTGVSISVQIKSGAKYKRSSGYAIPIDDHGDDWRDSLLPVFGVVFDVETRRLFWTNLTQSLIESPSSTWIQLDRANELTESTVEQFIEQAHAYAQKRSEAGHGISLQVYPISAISRSEAWFVGRDREQRELRRLLSFGEHRSLLITGMAGVGKTALVSHIVRDPQVQATFPGGVAFVDMQGFSGERRLMGRPGAAYAPLLVALGFPLSQVPTDINGQAATYHKFLEDCADSGKGALLVFDNVAEISQIAELLPKSSIHGAVITSRVKLGIIDRLEIVHLNCMNPTESEDLFRSGLPACGRDFDPALVRELCELCGHLPLALRIAAAIVKEDISLNLRDLIEELAENKTRLDVLQYGDSAVRAALQVSFHHLEEELRDPFCKLSVNPGTSISEEMVGVVLETPTLRARSVLRRLGQASLIARGGSSTRWKMHDLVYLFSAEQAEQLGDKNEYKRCFSRMVERYEGVSAEADSVLRGAPDSNVRFKTIPEALAWFDDDCANLRGAALKSRDAGMHEASYYISMNLTLYFDLRLRVDDALQCAISAHEAARALKDAERQVRALNNIGLTLTSQRRFKEAIPKLTKANAIAERIGFVEGECDSVISLGAAVRQHQGARAAIPILIRAANLAKKSGNAGSIASSLTNLGSAYREAGELPSAVKVLSESIVFHQKSGDHRKEASAHGGLGAALSNMGYLEAAVESFRKAFPGYEEVQDLLGINLTWANLGGTYLKMGRAVDAVTCLKRALEYFASVDNAYYQALCLMNLGQSELDGGSHSGARDFFLQARTKYEECEAPEGVHAANAALRELDEAE